MMTGKLSPEGEVIAAYGAAMVAAFQVLINCLEENDAVLPGQFPDALGVYMEMVKSKKGDVSEHDACGAPRYSDGYTGLIITAPKKIERVPYGSPGPSGNALGERDFKIGN
jgi:hypothetical protein